MLTSLGLAQARKIGEHMYHVIDVPIPCSESSCNSTFTGCFAAISQRLAPASLRVASTGPFHGTFQPLVEGNWLWQFGL